MATYISADFIERHLSTLSHVPADWEISSQFNYALDLKMCQISTLKYGFRWGDGSKAVPKAASLIEQPMRILKLDLSLNELTTLTDEGLKPLWNIRELDVSLNRLDRLDGLSVLHHLHSLNLSHNVLPSCVHMLHNNKVLYELNVGMNEIRDIHGMPSFMKLKILHLNNNKIRSLEGIQALPHLRELYVQRNMLKNIIPLMSCLHLVTLNASENEIDILQGTVDVLKGFKHLQSLCLFGNPIEKDANYQSDLIRYTSVVNLDNVSIKPLPKHKGYSQHASNIVTIKDAAEHAFYDQMKARKQIMEENVRFLQKRIVSLQDEYYEYEAKMKRDLDSCLRYLEGLSIEEVNIYDNTMLRDTITSPQTKPWERPLKDTRVPRHDPELAMSERPLAPRKDYSGIKDTDEVLRLAYNELAKDKANNTDPVW